MDTAQALTNVRTAVDRLEEGLAGRGATLDAGALIAFERGGRQVVALVAPTLERDRLSVPAGLAVTSDPDDLLAIDPDQRVLAC